MRYLIIAGIIIVAIFLFFLLKIPIGIEPLTEAYFEDHTKLPVNIFLKTDYNYSFSVHNLEYMNMSYRYEITSSYRNETKLLEIGNFSLENNETATFKKELKISEHFDRAKINIHLVKLQENLMQKDPNLKDIAIDIHFWVDEITGPRIIIVPD